MKYLLNTLLLSTLLTGISSHAFGQQKITQQNTTQSTDMNNTQKNKALVQKLYDEGLNKRNTEVLNDLISGDYTGVQGEKGAAGFLNPLNPLIKAFPDIQWNIQEIIGDSNKVMVRWKLQGTQTAQYQNIATTGKTISNNGMAVFELKDGKIIKGLAQTDRLGFLQELDQLPPDLNTLAYKKPGKDAIAFMDKFTVPANSKKEFLEKLNENSGFLKKLPGFVKGEVFEQTDDKGNFIYITANVWENEEAMNHAKQAMQAEFKRTAFVPADFYKRLDIKLERGIYRPVNH